MTKKEAIEIMARRIFMSKYEQAIKVLKILYSDKFQQFTSSEFDDAIYMAIEALEKQIPKKPIKYDIDYSGNPLFRCPVCGDSWNSNEFGDGIEYCWTCGQAIDWSDEDA